MCDEQLLSVSQYSRSLGYTRKSSGFSCVKRQRKALYFSSTQRVYSDASVIYSRPERGLAALSSGLVMSACGRNHATHIDTTHSVVPLHDRLSQTIPHHYTSLAQHRLRLDRPFAAGCPNSYPLYTTARAVSRMSRYRGPLPEGCPVWVRPYLLWGNCNRCNAARAVLPCRALHRHDGAAPHRHGPADGSVIHQCRTKYCWTCISDHNMLTVRTLDFQCTNATERAVEPDAEAAGSSLAPIDIDGEDEKAQPRDHPPQPPAQDEQPAPPAQNWQPPQLSFPADRAVYGEFVRMLVSSWINGGDAQPVEVGPLLDMLNNYADRHGQRPHPRPHPRPVMPVWGDGVFLPLPMDELPLLREPSPELRPGYRVDLLADYSPIGACAILGASPQYNQRTGLRVQPANRDHLLFQMGYSATLFCNMAEHRQRYHPEQIGRVPLLDEHGLLLRYCPFIAQFPDMVQPLLNVMDGVELETTVVAITANQLCAVYTLMRFRRVQPIAADEQQLQDDMDDPDGLLAQLRAEYPLFRGHLLAGTLLHSVIGDPIPRENPQTDRAPAGWYWPERADMFRAQLMREWNEGRLQ